jgi:hypothetical protein
MGLDNPPCVTTPWDEGVPGQGVAKKSAPPRPCRGALHAPFSRRYPCRHCVPRGRMQCAPTRAWGGANHLTGENRRGACGGSGAPSSLSDLSNQGVQQGDKTLLEAKSRCSIGCRAPNLPKFSAKRRSDRKVRQAARSGQVQRPPTKPEAIAPCNTDQT